MFKSLGEMASNIACSLEGVLTLAMAFSFVAGLILAIHTIYTYKNKSQFKQNGEDWESWSTITSAVIKFAIAVMFVSFPTYIASAAETFSIGDGQQLSSQFCSAEPPVIEKNDKSVGGIAKNVENSLLGVKGLAEALAYVAGFFMGMGSLFKFKAYRDSPQQTPLGTPITWLGIAVFLIFLPEFFGSGAQTIWGGEATQVEPWSD